MPVVANWRNCATGLKRPAPSPRYRGRSYCLCPLHIPSAVCERLSVPVECSVTCALGGLLGSTLVDKRASVALVSLSDRIRQDGAHLSLSSGRWAAPRRWHARSKRHACPLYAVLALCACFVF
jgi:hypothetical protein